MGRGAREDRTSAPFKINYVEVGNEDFFDRSGTYDQRFVQFHDAIKARYPTLKVISSVGFEQPEARASAASHPTVWTSTTTPVDDVPQDGATGHYEGYDRRGPKIFVGEWGAYETPIEPWNAGRAARRRRRTCGPRSATPPGMTQMERNADIVIMHAYAPLLVNVSPGRQPVAAQPDRLRRAARLRLAELSRLQDVQHQPRRRDSEGDDDRHRGIRLGDARQPLGSRVREAGERDGCRCPGQVELPARRPSPGQPLRSRSPPIRRQRFNRPSAERRAEQFEADRRQVRVTYTVPASGIAVLTLERVEPPHLVA